MAESTCPFCDVPPDRILHTSTHARAFRDAYPVTEGHTLVVPKHHVTSLFELEPEAQADVWILVGKVRAELEASHEPEGFTVGVNDGTAAGQTIAHAHIHVIPRYGGDVPDPRGGIRWVIPERARYWDV